MKKRGYNMKNKMVVVGDIYVAGVYAMKDAEGIVKYIGSGLNCNDRLSSHLYFLNRNLYSGTNKQELQDIYDRGELTFEIIKISESNSEVFNMTSEKKKALQEALSVLESFYIELYKDTICNKQKSVKKHSSNRDELSTLKRRKANIGTKNPNCKNDVLLIANIIWLKNNGYENREIEALINGVIKKEYISQLGKGKWNHIKPVKPEWIDKIS